MSHDERIINVLKSDQAVVINPWPTMPKVKPYTLTRIDANMFDPAELLRTDFHSILYALYARPLEVTEAGDYQSNVLRKFNYDPKTFKLTLKLKKNLSFSNGESLTAEDLALTLARTAYLKPKLETFTKIKGMKEWLESNNCLKTLPKGISVFGSHTVEISFTEARKQPYYWLSLSIFGILSQSSIDWNTGKLLEKFPAFSGAYELKSHDDDILIFQKRWSNRKLPDTLTAIYPKNSFVKFLDYLKPKHLIDVQTTIFLNQENKKKLKNFRTIGTILNQSSGTFYDLESKTFSHKRVRQFFNQELRKTFCSERLYSVWLYDSPNVSGLSFFKGFRRKKTPF